MESQVSSCPLDGSTVSDCKERGVPWWVMDGRVVSDRLESQVSWCLLDGSTVSVCKES